MGKATFRELPKWATAATCVFMCMCVSVHMCECACMAVVEECVRAGVEANCGEKVSDSGNCSRSFLSMVILNAPRP